jgi:hypothetical protein
VTLRSGTDANNAQAMNATPIRTAVCNWKTGNWRS